MSEPVTIAIDASGGYHGAEPVVSAVGELSRQRTGIQAFYLLVGDESRIGELLVKTRHNPERITVVHAPASVPIGMPAHAEPSADQTAAEIACQLVRDGDADAVVTAGNPGATVLAAHDTFQMLPGIRRAALATVYPTWESDGSERFGLLLDVGATLHATADDLVAFALMGSAYSRVVTNRECPTVGLLSVSREPGVGPPEVVEAHQRLTEMADLDFVGSVEGHQIPLGGIDVIVCEGYVGDVAIKVLEGFADAAFQIAKDAYDRKLVYRMGLRLLSPGLRKIKRAVDFEEYGGAPLLGFDRVVILADPRSGSKAIQNAIKLAAKNVRADLSSQIAAIQP